MRPRSNSPSLFQALALAALAVAGARAPAQTQTPAPAAQTPTLSPAEALICTPNRQRCLPPPRYGDPCPPGAETMPPTPQTPSDATPAFEGLMSGADIGSNVALAPGGYLDSAIPKNTFRVRYDQGFNMNRPDRAEFFYAAWREISFHDHNILNQAGTFQATVGRGLDPLPGRADYQEVSAYLELAGGRRWSTFVEIPFRTLHLSRLFNDGDGGDAGIPATDPPGLHEALEENATNFGGIGDIVLGTKAAVIAEQDHYVSLQFRVFFPSGNARNGMGTGHYSAEPGLLTYRRLGERTTLQGQFKVWIPIDGTVSTTGRSFAGNVLIYGLGLGYDLVDRPNLRITPIAEFVGWTVLNGFETIFGQGLFQTFPTNHGLQDSTGATIVNGKLGVRAYFSPKDDVYVGFGQALTSTRWYNEILRVEYRRSW